MQIVGVGFDEPAVNQGWAEEEGFLFELWTDGPERPLAVHYGAPLVFQGSGDEEDSVIIGYVDQVKARIAELIEAARVAKESGS